MPIRPENRARYPKDWRAISLRIRQRADGRCECTGQCGSEHESGRCGAPNGMDITRNVHEPARWLVFAEMIESGVHDLDYWSDPVMVVLTVMHLDQTPENCADDNLLAACQRCHLRYDGKQHAATARVTRRAVKAAGELF